MRETQRLGVPIIGLVDTNADPTRRSTSSRGTTTPFARATSSTRVIADGIAAGRSKVTTAELAAPAVETAEEPEESEDASAEEAAPDEPELEPAAVAEGSESE